ncbi:hypothetical protein ACSHWB_16345 [Lentzea sp. HUAS TT2]|uniref:hypothetical protein n=1 Tax=Lentzea sp. HUAS TT2 TaxID=3447454 RepID=UPI003F6E9C10
MIISSTGVPAEPRLLDALAVEAALAARRPFDQLAPAEAAEVARILRRRAAGNGIAARHVRGASA